MHQTGLALFSKLLRPFLKRHSLNSIFDLLILNRISNVFCVEIPDFFSKILKQTSRPHIQPFRAIFNPPTLV